MPRTRVLIADDHRLMREGTSALLRTDERLEVVGLASNGREAVAMATRRTPDVALIDLDMPELGGIETCAAMREQLPDIQVLILTVSEREADLYAALRVGAAGYLLKDMPPTELVEAILQAGRGEPRIDPAMAHRMLGDMTAPDAAGRRLDDLSDREREVLALLARGRRNREIAETPFRHRGDRQDPRPAHPREAADPQPRRGRGVRGAVPGLGRDALAGRQPAQSGAHRPTDLARRACALRGDLAHVEPREAREGDHLTLEPRQARDLGRRLQSGRQEHRLGDELGTRDGATGAAPALARGRDADGHLARGFLGPGGGRRRRVDPCDIVVHVWATLGARPLPAIHRKDDAESGLSRETRDRDGRPALASARGSAAPRRGACCRGGGEHRRRP